MSINFLPNLRWGNKFVVDIDIAFFPRPFPPSKLLGNIFPISFFFIFAKVPLFEMFLILIFARDELASTPIIH